MIAAETHNPFAVKHFNNSIMKKNTRLFVGIAMAVAIAVTLVSANAAVDKSAIKAAFAKAPGVEMPYIANSLVAKAKKVDKARSEEHTSELQSQAYLVCRLLLEKKKNKRNTNKHV